MKAQGGKTMKKLLALVLSLVMVIGLLAGCSKPAGGTDGEKGPSGSDYSNVKIGVMLSGSANDGGWSQMAADAATAAAKKYAGATVNFTESIPASDYESVMRGYADAGYTLIVAHGAEFLDVTKLVAADYPNVKFINTSAQEAGMAGAPANVTGIDFATFQLGFLNGAAAAMATQTKKIGAVGSNEIDSIIAWQNGVIAGAKYIDPSCEVTAVYTGSYDDALKAKQAVDALKEQGCDIITQNADACGTGAVQECDELGLMNVGAVSDQTTLGESCFISVGQDAQLGIEMAVEMSIAGTLASGFVSMGADVGVITMSEYSGLYADKLSTEQKAQLQDLWQQAYDGVDLATLAK
jgi:basic membrane protein A